MFFRLNPIVAETEVLKDLLFLLVIGAIILIIVFIFLFIYSKTISRNKKHHQSENNHDDHDLRKDISQKEERISDYKRLFLERNELQSRKRELEEEREILIRKIHELESKVEAYDNKYGSISGLDSSIHKQMIHTSKFDNPNHDEKPNYEESLGSAKIIVSFSFEDKNGTVKRDDSGDMFLERKNNEQFDLYYEKEIYGTAIHLEQLQYNYKILNPDKANNKSMRVIKRPLYTFNKSIDRGFLIKKGEVEYQ